MKNATEEKTAQVASAMHLALVTSDLARSIDFYRTLFGLEPDKVRPEYARFSLAEPALVFTLNASPVPLPAGRLSHLGLRIDDQDVLDAARQRLREQGFALREEHESTCCYAVQNKFWITDPDGNEWEFYRVLADADAYAATECATSAGPCCGE